MTSLAIGSYSNRAVRRIISAVIICQVATHTSIWWIGIITIMTQVTVVNVCMCPGERVIIVMN